MKTQTALTYAEVRQAGLEAKVDLPHVTHEYRPLDGAVVVKMDALRGMHLSVLPGAALRPPCPRWPA